MKDYLKFYIYLVFIFLVIQIFGLYLTTLFINQEMVTGLFTKDPNNLLNAVFLFLEILVFTVLILVLRKYFKGQGYLYIFEFLALFLGMILVFDLFLPYLSAVIVAFLVLMIRKVLNKGNFKNSLYWFNNLILGISISGIGSLLGLSLGFFSVMLFLVILSVYDLVAVFYTKHMITLANMFTKKKLALVFYLPTKKRVYQLGGGDIVLPLCVSSSAFYFFNNLFGVFKALISVIAIWIASLLGLFWVFYIIKKNKAKAMPALPPQTFLIVLVVLVLFIIFSLC